MNMSEDIINILNSFLMKLGISVDWTSENVLDKLQEFITTYSMYCMLNSVISIIVCTIVIGIFLELEKRLKNNKQFGIDKDRDNLYRRLCFIIIYLVYIAAIICIIYHLFEINTAIMFPQKLLFQELLDAYTMIK